MKMPDWLKKPLLYPFYLPYIWMPGRSFKGAVPPLLAEEMMLRDRLEGHVNFVAGGIGDRSIRRPAGLKAAEQYAIACFSKIGYPVWRQPFRFASIEMNNVFVVKQGRDPSAGVLVVGAHYDTVPGTPGADDNATGFGALIELAAWLFNQETQMSVILVAFANEENSGGPWETMGSCHFAKLCRQKRWDIRAMLSLEMLGVFSNEPGSQKYPHPFNLFYPRTANFIAFVGNRSSKELVRRCVKSFRNQVQFPCEGVAAPDSLKDAGRSDHWAFWQIGVPALMVTDTSNFRYELYHTRKDTPDQIDFVSYTRVTRGMFRVVHELVN